MTQVARVTYFLILLTRVVSAPLILVFPFLGWILGSSLDGIDYVIGVTGDIKFSDYQLADKIIDVWLRVFIIIAAFQLQWPIAWLFLLLFFYRLIGEGFLYFSSGYAEKQWLLVAFPNLNGFLFPIYLIYSNTYPSNQNPLLLAGVILLAFTAKLLHEYITHIAKWKSPIHVWLLKRHPKHARPKNG